MVSIPVFWVNEKNTVFLSQLCARPDWLFTIKKEMRLINKNFKTCSKFRVFWAKSLVACGSNPQKNSLTTFAILLKFYSRLALDYHESITTAHHWVFSMKIYSLKFILKFSSFFM